MMVGQARARMKRASAAGQGFERSQQLQRSWDDNKSSGMVQRESARVYGFVCRMVDCMNGRVEQSCTVFSHFHAFSSTCTVCS